MRYGIFSDVHSNLEALNRVLEDSKKENIDNFICLGDLVGYGANPNECVELIRALKPVIVAGNHDCAVVNRIDTSGFNKWGSEAVLWTQKIIKPDNVSFLNGLKLMQDHNDFTLVHASPYFPEKWFYVITVEDIIRCFLNFKNWICFVGHSHRPFIFELNPNNLYNSNIFLSGEVVLKKEMRYVISAGSVGQPRDGNNKTCYFVFDSESKKIKLTRLEYNYELTQKKILDAGLPGFLAERLAKGK
ncbi:MAG: metallophosphoesterase family protein [bacterium]|nr:metallophosphoesterase family protein [bacterium]